MRYGIDSRWHDNISHPPKNRHMVQMNRYNSRGYPGSGFSLRPRDLSSNESEDMRSTVVPNKEALKEKKEARDDDMAQVTPTFRHALQSDRRPVSW